MRKRAPTRHILRLWPGQASGAFGVASQATARSFPHGEELARSPSFPPKIKKKNSLYYFTDNPATLERPIFNGSRDHGRNTSCDRAITARNTSCAVSCAVIARPLKKWVVPLRFVAFCVFPCALCVRLSRRFDHTRRRNTFLLGFTVRSWGPLSQFSDERSHETRNTFKNGNGISETQPTDVISGSRNGRKLKLQAEMTGPAKNLSNISVDLKYDTCKGLGNRPVPTLPRRTTVANRYPAMAPPSAAR